MVKRPLVSVIIPAHNEERFIEETINSILAQTYKNFEIIIVDDGSNDDTRKIVQKLMKNDKRIKLVPFNIGHSAAFARNNGVKNAKGEIIIFQDADCFAESKVIESVVKNIQAGVDGVASRTLFMPPKTIIANAIAVQRSLRWETHEDKKKKINFDSGILVANMRKECFEKIGGFNEKIFYFEDEDLTRRFFEAGYKAVYEPNARELHHDPDTLSESIGQSKHFGKGIAWKIKRGQGFSLLIYPVYSVIFFSSIILSFLNLLFLILALPVVFIFIKVALKSKKIVPALVFTGLFLIRNLVKMVSFIKNVLI